MIESALVRWPEQSNWHFTPSINHGDTACGVKIPLHKVSPEYAEIDILEIASFKGLCKKCFHEICIDVQDQKIWAIYYAHIAEFP